MRRAADHLGQGVVDHAVALEGGFAIESGGFDFDGEVAAAGFAGPGVTGVKMRLVFDHQVGGREGFGEQTLNFFGA